MPGLPDDILLEKLKQDDSASYNLIYSTCFNITKNYIRQNGGSDQDAEDIFQESMLVLLAKIKQPNFVLTASLKTYLLSVSKNLWLKKIRNDKRLKVQNSFADIDIIDDDEQPIQIIQEEKVTAWLAKITSNCQRILKAIFYLNEPMNALMVKMGWKNKHTAANQKFKCIEQVRKATGK